MELRDKVVIVTGAGSGIGAGLVAALLRAGAKVVLAGRREEKLQESASRGKRGCTNTTEPLIVPTDLADYEGLEQLVRKASEHFGCIDVLINNAGVNYGGTLEDLRPDEIEYTIKVNLVAPMWLTQLCLPHLRQRPEAMLVNVASLSGLIGIPYQTVYCGSKFGLSGFSQALYRELRRTTIHVLGVYPGAVDSDMNTAKMRERAAGAGVSINALSPDTAARQVVAAMQKKSRRVIVSAPGERLLPFLAKWAPCLADRAMRRISSVMYQFMLDGNTWQRSRNDPPQSNSSD